MTKLTTQISDKQVRVSIDNGAVGKTLAIIDIVDTQHGELIAKTCELAFTMGQECAKENVKFEITKLLRSL